MEGWKMTDSAKRIMQGLEEALAHAQGDEVPGVAAHMCRVGDATEELRAAVQEGLDSGPSRRADMDDIKAEARRRLESTRSD
jgi:hypothetical protein